MELIIIELAKGYFKIARHYGWALNHTFMEMGFDQVRVKKYVSRKIFDLH